MTEEHGAIGRHYVDRMAYEDFRTLGGGDMRGIHRSRGWHRKAGPRFGLVVLVVSLALVISQSLGMIAANAFGPETFGAWGSNSTSTNPSRSAEKASDNASVSTRDRSSAGASVTALAPIEVPSGSTDLEGRLGDDSKWTDGNLCAGVPKGQCYKELDQVPHRIIFTGLSNGQEYFLDVLIEFKDNANHTGYDQLTGPTSVSGAISGATFTQQANQTCGGKTCKVFRLSFTATGSDGIIEFDVRLGIGAHLWNGSNLSVELGNGNETVPLPVNEIVFDVVAHKFNDLNSNGTQDTGEPDLPGWIMTLYKGTGCSQQATVSGNPGTTNANGNVTWSVTGADTDQSGNLSVAETLQAGWTNTTPICQITQGQQVNFGNHQLQPPTISITKVADATPVVAGSPIGFVITATAGGTGLATGVTVTDNLPDSGLNWSIDAGGSDSGCSISGAVGSQVLTCNFGTLASGSSKHVHITSPTTTANCGEVNNTASVSSTNAGQDSDSESITVNCPSISITKVADATPVVAGSPIGFVITATAGGTGSATGVTVTDNLPDSGLNWSIDAGGSDSGCSISGAGGSQVLTCNFGPLASGSSKHVHITSPTTTANCGEVNNTASVSSTNAGQDSDSESITVNCPSISITKVADATPVVAGSPIGFVITATAGGTGSATGVTVTDNLPDSGLNWSIDAGGSDSGCSISGAVGSQVLTCNFGTLASGSSKHVHITSPTTTANCGEVNNTASVSSTNAGQDSDSESITVNCPSISITKVADATPVVAGSPIGFVITATAGGTGSATGVTVTDNLPDSGLNWSIDAGGSDSGCSISGAVGSQVLTCNFGTLASGSSKHVHITSPTTTANCGEVNNTASVSSTNAGQDSDSESITVNCPSISITKVADATPVVAGSPIGFVITATAGGTGSATGVTVTDNLPDSGLNWSIDAGGSDSGCSISGAGGSQVLTCNFGPLASGSSKHVHITSPTTTANCGEVNNTASVSSTNAGQDSDSESITVNCPSISITKVADATPVVAGSPIGFVITATAGGTGSATGVTVTDNLPDSGLNWSIDAGGSDSGCSISGAVGSQVLTCNFGTLASGSSKHVHITSPTTTANCGEVNNTASVSSTNAGQDSDSESITVNCPSISITKVADATPVVAGSPIGFVITATAGGTGSATGVTVTDNLPDSGLNWSIDAGGSDSGCSISGAVGSQVLTCNFGTLASGSSKHVHITSPTTTANCGEVNNTASVSSTNAGQDSDSESITVNCPSISITKVADATPVVAGSPIGFVITATAGGTGSATGVTVTDNLPDSGLNWSIDAGGSDSGCSISGAVGSQVLTCNFGTLASGSSKHVHITSPTTTANCGEVNNTASVSSTNAGQDSDSESITVNCPSISITKVADATPVVAGSPIGFVITATAGGTGSATGVTVTDNLPDSGLNWSIDAGGSDSGCSISGAGGSQVLTCNFGPLASGSSKHVHITSPTTTANCGEVNNTASVSSTNAGQDSDSESITVNCPSISITKVADATPVVAGSPIGFVITATAGGTGSATGVTVTDNLPDSGLNWSIDAGGSDSGCSISGAVGSQVLTCNFGTLASGSSKHVHITSPTTTANCGEVNNTASVSSTNAGQDSDSESITVNCPSISITKVADATPVVAGSPIGFVITATAGGTGSATGVTVTDNLPDSGLNWSIDAGGSDSGCSISGAVGSQVLTCNFGTLASGSSKHVHITSPTTTANCGEVNNTASVSSTNAGQDSDSESITVNCPSISITKVADATPVVAGSPIGFVITATAGGTGSATGVTVTDNLPDSGLNWSIDAGGSDSGCSISGAVGSQVLTCNFGTLASGSSKHVHITSP